MSDRPSQQELQPPGRQSNPYNRVQDRYVCGRVGDGGVACPLGPDRRGRCQVSAECAPEKRGDRWHCTRGAAAGGPCGTGPLPDGRCCRPVPPCRPRPGLRVLRGRFGLAVTALCLGLIAIVLGWPGQFEQQASPGELSSAHQSPDMACDDCHSTEPDGLTAALAGPGTLAHRALGDSRLCLDCHQTDGHPLQAHGLASDQRPDAVAGERLLRFRVLQASGLQRDSDPVACQTCHHEHRGTAADPSSISDLQCQSCHGASFPGFSEGHPGFSGYPFRARSAIQYDHSSHRNTHFLASDVPAPPPATCGGCHQPSGDDGQMALVGYEQACAGCHDDQIRGAGQAGDPGLPVLRVPGLDVESLRLAGHPIGGWPRYAEGRSTPFLLTMLQREPDTAAALAVLDGRDWLDLQDASDEELAAAATIGWAIKRLFHRLVTEGQVAFLDAAGGSEQETAAALLGGLAPATIQAAQQAWFPDLAEEIARQRLGLPLAADLAAAPAAPVTTGAGGPPPADDSDDLLAGDDLLLGDDLLAGDDLLQGDDLLIGGDDLLAGDDLLLGDDLLTGGDDLLAGDDLLQDNDLLIGGDDLLAGDDLLIGGDDLLAGDDLLQDNDLLIGGDDLLAGETVAARLAVADPVPDPPVAVDQWTRFGGWYRQDLSYTLHYRPGQHADPFLQAWLEVSLASPGSDALLDVLSDPRAPGICGKCHTAGQPTDPTGALSGPVRVNWLARGSQPRSATFSRFDHTPHLGLSNDAGCETCHSLDPEADYAAAFDTFIDSGSDYRSNFSPIGIETCQQCHAPDAVTASCTTCHSYHVQPMRPVPSETLLLDPPSEVEDQVPGSRTGDAEQAGAGFRR